MSHVSAGRCLVVYVSAQWSVSHITPLPEAPGKKRLHVKPLVQLLTTHLIMYHKPRKGRIEESCFSYRFAFEVQPSGDISEYTATFTDGRTKEGGKGLIKVKTLSLKAEGTERVCVCVCVFENVNLLTVKVAL